MCGVCSVFGVCSVCGVFSLCGVSCVSAVCVLFLLCLLCVLCEYSYYLTRVRPQTTRNQEPVLADPAAVLGLGLWLLTAEPS